MNKRIIFHIDVNNAFLSWTAIYLLKNGYKQDIRNIPSIIGGDESKRNGIVLAKSNIAKKYGIVTAETLYQARKKCPQVQLFPPNYNWYTKKSNDLFTYLEKYSPTIEIYSIDECFIDMSGTSFLYENYEKLAHQIKDEIFNLFGFTVNIGIGNNKLCAKMASDFEKPNKVHTLYLDEIPHKMWKLSVSELFMCGKKTALRLNEIGIKTIGELATYDQTKLRRIFKNQAISLIESANGIDNSKVEYKKSKNESISITETLTFDCKNIEKLKEILFAQAEEVGRKLRKKEMYANTVAIIYKSNLFKTTSHQTKLETSINKTTEIYKTVEELLERSYNDDPIRLIGLRLSDLTTTSKQQISLFEQTKKDDNEDKVQELLDNINEKFGKTGVTYASMKVRNKERLEKKNC